VGGGCGNLDGECSFIDPEFLSCVEDATSAGPRGEIGGDVPDVRITGGANVFDRGGSRTVGDDPPDELGGAADHMFELLLRGINDDEADRFNGDPACRSEFDGRRLPEPKIILPRSAAASSASAKSQQ